MHTLSTPWLFNCEACTVIIKPFSHFNEYDVSASLVTGVLSSEGGVVGPYGRGMVRLYVGRLIGWAVSSSSKSNSSS